jgi:hypothetical protein
LKTLAQRRSSVERLSAAKPNLVDRRLANPLSLRGRVILRRLGGARILLRFLGAQRA